MGDGRFSGGRGRGGGRDSGPTGPPRAPDRLSNHTSDASMASARIFVGNLPTNDPRLNKELLEENFSQFGHIMGKLTHRIVLRLNIKQILCQSRNIHLERVWIHSIRR